VRGQKYKSEVGSRFLAALDDNVLVRRGALAGGSGVKRLLREFCEVAAAPRRGKPTARFRKRALQNREQRERTKAGLHFAVALAGDVEGATVELLYYPLPAERQVQQGCA
jgi:hypothetical protein